GGLKQMPMLVDPVLKIEGVQSRPHGFLLVRPSQRRTLMPESLRRFCGRTPAPYLIRLLILPTISLGVAWIFVISAERTSNSGGRRVTCLGPRRNASRQPSAAARSRSIIALLTRRA